MIGLGAVLYAASLPLAFRVFNAAFTNYRDMNPESMQDRLLSVSDFANALGSTYRVFYDGFFGNICLTVLALKCLYILIAALSIS